MVQQLNLLDPRFTPRPLPWSSRQGMLACAALLAACVAAGQAMQWGATRTEVEAKTRQDGNGLLRAQLLALPKVAAQDGSPDAELQRLKAVAAAQQRVQSTLAAGIAGNHEGHAEYLLALARQAPGTVWITGFNVSEDGSAIELEGRMIDTAVFANYLRRLNAEPRFRGRPFAQLQLKGLAAAGTADGGAVTEFALRSTTAAGGGRAPTAAAGTPATPLVLPGATPPSTDTLAAIDAAPDRLP